MQKEVIVPAPKFEYAKFKIRGTAPYVQNKFSEKAMGVIRGIQTDPTSRNKKKREPKDFQAIFEGAKHISYDGWTGMPASAFRHAMISACRTVGFKMTLAKLSVFIEADGFDNHDHQPLIKITKGEPEYFETWVNIQRTVDLIPRPMWRPGWEAYLTIRFDTDQFTYQDVANLLTRVGMQVGIGCGRPDSKNSPGMGWGLFEVVND